MWIIEHKRIFFSIATVLVLGSLLALGTFGMRPSIEFVGGTLFEISYTGDRADKALVEEQLNALALGPYSLRPFGEDAYVLRVREVEQSEVDGIVGAFAVNDLHAPELRRQNTVGPTIGKELQNKAFVALAVVIGLTILYVAFAFRGVSEPVSSWKYGLIAIIALVHDITIPLGVFSVVGYYTGTAELDILLVTALLTILGYSVNDTIVIFDRVRENIRKNEEDNIEEPFKNVVGASLEQTFVRSFNTSLTVLIVVVAIMLYGGTATQYFALALTVGVIAGTYSSLFLAAPLLVAVEERQRAQEQDKDSEKNRNRKKRK